MKKIILLLMAGTMALTAGAQYAPHAALRKDAGRQPNTSVATSHAAISRNLIFAKTTGVPFVTENFSTGTNTTLPAGWTAVPVQGNATWKWRKVACTGSYNIGVINSSTASNGWMVYDSDSIGALTHALNLEGYLESPSYGCSGRTSVGLSFQEWFRKFDDSCVVEVSNNNGATWTSFPVYANNALSNNDNIATNPFTVKINISSVAANQPSVKIRFRYVYNGIADGGYNWLIDDIALSELDPVDVAISKSFLFGAWGEYGASVATVPYQFVDTLEPFTLLSNYGANAQTNVGLSANIYKNGLNVYSKSTTFASLPVSAEDTLIDFVTKYLPTGTGDYVVAYGATQTGDADLSNNKDTVRFYVTDTLWAQNSGAVAGSVDVHRSSASNSGELSSYYGTRFDVPMGKHDTLSAVSVAFSSNTDPNSDVRVQIYKAGTQKWDIKAATLIKTLQPADISSSSNVVFTRFNLDFTGLTIGDFVLDEGSWAFVVTPHHVAPTNTVSVLTTAPSPATIYAGYFGQSGDAPNDANTYDFGTDFQTGITEIPMIRLHFGDASKLDINNTFITLGGNAYPNPANKTVNIPYTLKQDAGVVIEISNVIGQVVKTQAFGTVSANHSNEAVISTNDLVNGMYIYTIKANGQRATGKFVVAH